MPELVRLKGNPSMEGIMTDDPPKKRAGVTLRKVRFPGRVKWVPEYELEPVPAEESPLDLLGAGRLARSTDLRRVLTHVKLNGKLANIIYSMESTNTDYYAYQFKPVVKLLDSPLNGILIADEVGLGKTIEAGLIWTELKARFDYRKLLVLCPSVLKTKWKRELRNKFGLDAEICNAQETLLNLQDSKNDAHYGSMAVIASMQGLRPRKGWSEDDDIEGNSHSARLAKFLLEQENEEPLIDLLIIDEAHYMKNPETKTSKIGKLLRKVSSFVVLLSATPIHLGKQDLYQLANIIDEDTFDRESDFIEILSANEPLVKIRELVLSGNATTTDFDQFLDQIQSNFLLKDLSQIKRLMENRPSEEELKDYESRSELAYKLDTINPLGKVITRTRKKDVSEWRVQRRAISYFVKMTEPEREFYNIVTSTVREFCSQYDYHDGFLLVSPQRQMTSSMAAALMEWHRRRNEIEKEKGSLEEFIKLFKKNPDQYDKVKLLDEEFLSQIFEDFGRHKGSDKKLGPLITELLSKVDSFGDPDQLLQHDSKFDKLNSVLSDHISKNPEEKIIIFSYFKATLRYLQNRLSKSGLSCIILMGGMDTPPDQVISAFEDPNGPNILLSSEIGSEGIDLQFSHIIINYDLPWNPMRVEQRIGRVDRIGQESSTISILSFFYEDTIDARIYRRLFERLNIFESALGGMEDILGEQIQHLSYDLLSKKLTPEEQDRQIDQRYQALANIKDENERMENNAAYLMAYGDYILDQVNEARSLHRWITNKDLQTYVTDYMKKAYLGCTFNLMDTEESIYEISLSNTAKNHIEKYIKTHNLNIPTLLIQGSSRPIKCRFNNKDGKFSFGNIEVINQKHPIVRFVNYKINKEERPLYPAISAKIKLSDLDGNFNTGVYVFTVQKWMIEGIQNTEKLYYSMRYSENPEAKISSIDAEKIVMATAYEGNDWLEAVNQVDLAHMEIIANEYCLVESDTEFSKFKENFSIENEDRAKIQFKTLENHLEKQSVKYQNIIDRSIEKGNQKIVPMWKGKIAALQQRVERKKIEISEKMAKLNFDKDEICVGIINII